VGVKGQLQLSLPSGRKETGSAKAFCRPVREGEKRGSAGEPFTEEKDLSERHDEVIRTL